MGKWITPEIADAAQARFLDLGFIIHGDTIANQHKAYPTHTHGLVKFGIPEIFMHASCFGPQGNAHMINVVSVSLMLIKERLEKFKQEGRLEFRTGVYEDKDDFILCLRTVKPTFLGVSKAYQSVEISLVGHAQLYVKGDDHALTEDFYVQIPDYK